MEDDLIRRAQQGDQEAFRSLVTAYTDLVWRTASALLGDRLAVEDALQDAWLDVWRGLRGFRRDRPFRPWLLTVVANRCRMSARRQHLLTLPLDDDEATLPPEPDGAVEGLLRAETEAELLAATLELPAEQRRALELRYFAGLDLAEIALVMGTPAGTVKSRLHRALGALRVRLAQAHIAVDGVERRV